VKGKAEGDRLDFSFRIQRYQAGRDILSFCGTGMALVVWAAHSVVGPARARQRLHSLLATHYLPHTLPLEAPLPRAVNATDALHRQCGP
jgi:hypothetical protein